MQVLHQIYFIATTTIFLIQFVKSYEDSSFIRNQVLIRGTGSYEESHDRHWYKIYYGSDEMVDWVTAFKRCRAIGYHLVDLEDEKEISFVNDFVDRAGLRPHGIWSSASDIYQEDDFIWMSNGKSVNKKLWDSGEPNNAGELEHCVTLRDKGNKYRLNDTRCTDKWAYICKQRNGNPDF